MKKFLLFLASIIASLTAWADEGYAIYNHADFTLTFYYGTMPKSAAYSIDTYSSFPDWINNYHNTYIVKVVFDPSFAQARPTKTDAWFYEMERLTTIIGLEYLNTSEVTSMSAMFYSCRRLKSLDLSHCHTPKVTNLSTMFSACDSITTIDLSNFNTSQVRTTNYMFKDCRMLKTVYVGSEWTTNSIHESTNMFHWCSSIVGGAGTTYSYWHIDKEYAHIDGGPENPGYFTGKNIQGDVNGDGEVDVRDVTTLINMILGTIDMNEAGNVNGDNDINVMDVTALINLILGIL